MAERCRGLVADNPLYISTIVTVPRVLAGPLTPFGGRLVGRALGRSRSWALLILAALALVRLEARTTTDPFTGGFQEQSLLINRNLANSWWCPSVNFFKFQPCDHTPPRTQRL